MFQINQTSINFDYLKAEQQYLDPPDFDPDPDYESELEPEIEVCTVCHGTLAYNIDNEFFYCRDCFIEKIGAEECFRKDFFKKYHDLYVSFLEDLYSDCKVSH